MVADTKGAQALRRFHHTFSQLRGWRRRGVSFASGVAAALALAPFYFLPLLALSFTILIILLDGAAEAKRPIRTAAMIGWFFGFGYFLVGLYWLGFAFLVQADQFAWMIPFAVSGMPAFLAFFYASACALAVAFWRQGWRRGVVFALSLMIFEYARGHILTGLPWNLPGQALAGTAVGAQTAAIWGAYGLSLAAALLALAPAMTIGRHGARWRGTLIMAGGTAVLFAVGALRLAMIGPDTHANTHVRIVQPSIAQTEKIDPQFWWRNFERHLDLSKGIEASDAQVFVIWPENGVPVIDEVDEALSELSAALPDNATLIAGSVRREEDAQGTQRFFNSIAFVEPTPEGRRAVAHYDKHHLVPFGEYLPLKGVLRALGLSQLAPFEDGFTPGAGPQAFSFRGPAFAPLICYEAIFPGAMYPKGRRPEWLVTVTNDAWYGDTSGPRQHLDQARLRSIETGLPMARAANTGISALIDARGVYVSRLPLYETGAIDAPLPKPLKGTIYAAVGDSFFILMVLALAVVAQLWRK